MAAKTAYQAWDVVSQVEKIMAISNEFKEAYKNEINMPVQNFADVESAFAPSKLFWSDSDLLYSNDPFSPEEEYVWEFLENDERAPYRGNYKRTEVGVMFPELMEDKVKPGDKLIIEKQPYVPIWQDETAPIEDWRLRNMVDWHMFDLTTKFLDAQDYFRVVGAVLNAIREGNALVERCIVDTFLTSVAGVYSYMPGDILFPMFCGTDDYTPDEAYSKGGRAFFLKNGAIRKRMAELIKYVQKYYTARDSYLTNLNTHEIIGQALDKTIPKWNEKLADRSDTTKALNTVRDWYLEVDSSGKKNHVGYSLRRASLDVLASQIDSMIKRMTTRNAQNWCGHKFGQDNKNNEGIFLKVQPQNLLVFMNTYDLADIGNVKGDFATGPFTESQPALFKLKSWIGKGIRIYGLNYILPGMVIAVDRHALRVKQYFEKTYEQFHIKDLVESRINHMLKKICLYRKVVCNTLEPAKGQKFAVPIAWGSQHLPYIREPQ